MRIAPDWLHPALLWGESRPTMDDQKRRQWWVLAAGTLARFRPDSTPFVSYLFEVIVRCPTSGNAGAELSH